MPVMFPSKKYGPAESSTPQFYGPLPLAHALLHFVGPKHIIQKIFISVSLDETPVAGVEPPLEVAVREAPVGTTRALTTLQTEATLLWDASAICGFPLT